MRVRADTTYPANTRIYFRAFDLDDPSTDAAPVDRNGAAGNDNRGTNQTGTLSVPSALTDANRMVRVTFSTTKHPGDNFMIAASADQAYLNAITVNGTTLRDGTGATLPTMQAKNTAMLTVWRNLNIEVDSMGPVTGNVVNSTVNFATPQLYEDSGPCPFGPPPPPGKPPGPCYNRGIHSIYANGLPTDPLRYGGYFSSSSNYPIVQGRFFSNGTNYGVWGNTTGAVDIFTPSLSAPGSGTPFTLFDDDDYNENDNMFQGDISEDVAATIYTLTTMRSSDTPCSGVHPRNVLPNCNAFAQAYIRPAYNGGGSLSNEQSNLPFMLNINDRDANAVSSLLFSNNQSYQTENDDFWSVYVFLAYQGITFAPDQGRQPFGDNDPGTESGTAGVTAPTSAFIEGCDINSAEAVPSGGYGSFVFLESMTDDDNQYRQYGSIENRASTATHEVGHQFGLKGDDANMGIMSDQQIFFESSPTATIDLTFTPCDLNMLRWRARAPGQTQ